MCVSVSAPGPIDRVVVTFNTAAGTAGNTLCECLEAKMHVSMKPQEIQTYGMKAFGPETFCIYCFYVNAPSGDF